MVEPTETEEGPVVFSTCPKCQFETPEPMEACPSCGIIYADEGFKPRPKPGKPKIIWREAGPESVSKAPLVAAALLLILGVWWVNVVNTKRHLKGAMNEDPPITGVELGTHYAFYLRSSVLVFDVRKIEGETAAGKVFLALRRYAKALSDDRFDNVELAVRGSTRFILPGAEFRRLGREFGLQNPAYVARSFAESVIATSGGRPYPAREGTLEEVVPQQLADLRDLFGKWFLSELGANPSIDLENPSEVATKLIGIDGLESYAKVTIPEEEGQGPKPARLALEGVTVEPLDEASRVSVGGTIRNTGGAPACRVTLRLEAKAGDGKILGKETFLLGDTIPPGSSSPFRWHVDVPKGTKPTPPDGSETPLDATTLAGVTTTVDRFKETCK
jgi:hypothetical protein